MLKMLNALVVVVMLGTAHSALLDTAPIAKFSDEDARDWTLEDTIDNRGREAPSIIYEDTEPDAKYVIEDVQIGDLQTKVLKNTITGEYVQVVTDLGGRIEDLVLRGSDRKLRSVLLTHHNNATAIKENAWWRNAILLPYANRIDGGKYSFYNGSYQLPINDVDNNNAIHGFLENKSMKVESQMTNWRRAVVVLSYQFDGKDQGYPFYPLVEITYTLSRKGFDISFAVTNSDKTYPMLFYVGWHPYFKCSVYQSVITFDKCTRWAHVQLNSRAIPTGITSEFMGFDGSTPIGGSATNPTHYDDAYKAIGRNDTTCSMFKTSLHDPATDQTVVLYQDSNFPFLQVFTGIVSGTGEDAVAIEPMSAMTNAFNNHDHLEILSGGEIWKGSFGVYVE